MLAVLKMSKVLAHFDSDNNLSSLYSVHLKKLKIIKCKRGQNITILHPLKISKSFPVISNLSFCTNKVQRKLRI